MVIMFFIHYLFLQTVDRLYNGGDERSCDNRAVLFLLPKLAPVLNLLTESYTVLKRAHTTLNTHNNTVKVSMLQRGVLQCKIVFK